MPDGRTYRAELWQVDSSYHMTIFFSRPDDETTEQAARLVESALIQFCGKKYRRVETVAGEPVWSYNVVVCDERDQFVTRLPLFSGLESFSIWFGERQVVVHGAGSDTR